MGVGEEAYFAHGVGGGFIEAVDGVAHGEAGHLG